MTAILGYIELLDRAGPINELQRDFINRVQTSVHSITSLVNDLLNLGRIESGFDTRKETISLSDILNSSLTSVEERLKKGSLTLSKNYKLDLPPLYGNPIQIRQMVDNLLDNAITYTPEGGKIKVEAQVDGKQLILLVSDTGNGIPALDMPYIFDKFYRASNTSSDFPGSGLGLSIVKSIIETHQGRIWVDSTIDKGTNVTVVLPIAEGAAA